MKSLLPNWSVEVSDFKEVSRVVRKQGSVLLQPLTPEKEGSTKKIKQDTVWLQTSMEAGGVVLQTQENRS